MSIGLRIAIGNRPHLITRQVPRPPDPTGDGRYVETWVDDDQWWGKVEPASAADLERSAAGTTLTSASRIVTVPYLPDLTTQQRLTWADRQGGAHVANITGWTHTADETATVIQCEELAP